MLSESKTNLFVVDKQMFRAFDVNAVV